MAKLHEADVDRLHPTQISVGMIEVHDKRKHLRELGHAARRDYRQAHPIPAVLGPERRL
ncbi:ParB-like protein, partial [Acinetobacter baumannii]